MSITLIIGPMFSGKTTEMFRLVRNKYIADNTVRVYKYDKDVRYRKKELACSHDGQEYPAIPINDFTHEIVPDNIDVIGIDEGQFITGLVEFCERNAEAGKTIIVSGLDSNFKKEAFQSIINLIPKCEHIEKLHAVCILCKKDASFTRKLNPENTEIEDIGGADKYLSTCRSCFTKEIDPKIWMKYQLKMKFK